MADMPVLLQKLMAHEKSAREIGNLAEAEAFAAKIADLMFKHNLSMSDVEVAQQEKDEPIDREFVRMGGKARSIWMEMLASAVATASFCHHRIVLGTDTQVFIGRTSDRKAAALMFAHLVGAAEVVCKREKLALRDTNPMAKPRARQKFAHEWGKAFFLGYANALAARLRVTRQQLTGAVGGTALILRKDGALNAWEAAHKPTGNGTAKVLKINRVSTGGYQAGLRAGAAVNLQPNAQLGRE